MANTTTRKYFTKYLYTYSVVAPSGRIIYAHDPDQKRAERLASLATANRRGTDYPQLSFTVRRHRSPNPNYVLVDIDN